MGLTFILVVNVLINVLMIYDVELGTVDNALNKDSALCMSIQYDCDSETSEAGEEPVHVPLSIEQNNSTVLHWEYNVTSESAAALAADAVSSKHSEDDAPVFTLHAQSSRTSKCWAINQSFATDNSDGWSYSFPCLEEGVAEYNISIILPGQASSTYHLYQPQHNTTMSTEGKKLVYAIGVVPSSFSCQFKLHVTFPAQHANYSGVNYKCSDTDELYNVTALQDQVEFMDCSSSQLCPQTISHVINIVDRCLVSPTLLPTSTTPALVVVPEMSTQLPTGEWSTDDSVIQMKSPVQTESNNTETIIAVVSAVFAALFITTVVFCIYRKKRQREEGDFAMRRLHNGGDSDNSSVNMEKSSIQSPPSVLVLYSYDTEVHERVVVELCAYLQHELGCEVALDIWAQEDIRTRGAAKWLEDKLDFSDFIFIISSAGARFKCNRKNQFRMRQNRPVPDLFVYGANQVAEKVRFAKMSGNCLPQCYVICLEYTTPSDIPPKLDSLQTFQLMKEINMLYCLVNKDERDGSCLYGKCIESYNNTSTGKQLSEALKDAVQYFKDNPDWLGQTLERTSGDTPSLQSTSADSDKSNPDGTRKTNEDALLLEKRQNKRKTREELSLQKVPSSNHISPKHGTGVPITLNTPIPPPSRQVIGNKSIAVQPTLQNTNVPQLEEEEETVDEMAELQKDIDFIQNYQWNNNNKAEDTLIPLEHNGLSSSFEESMFSFANPLYVESSTKHMLHKNGLGRISVGLRSGSNRKMKANHTNNVLVNLDTFAKTGSGGSSTYL